MPAVLLELIARLCFTAIGILNKASRRTGVTANGIMGQYAWALPFYAALGLGMLLYNPDKFSLGLAYWQALGLWVLLCLALNYIIFYLSRFQSLIEMGGYKLGFSMIVSLLIDWLYYGNPQFSPIFIGGGILATAGGWLLTSRPKNEAEEAARIPLPFPFWVMLLLSLSVAALAPVGYAMYKECLTLAGDSPLLHTVFSQSLLFTIFWFLGGRDYNKAVDEEILPKSRVIGVAACVVLAALVQTWSIAALSVTSLMVLGLLTGALCAANDILTGEVARNRRNIAAIALVFIGSALIAVSKF